MSAIRYCCDIESVYAGGLRVTVNIFKGPYLYIKQSSRIKKQSAAAETRSESII